VIANFTATKHCTSRAHCATCRADAAWRAKVGAPEVCPHIGLGSALETILRPIAKVLKLNCHDANGHLKPNTPCHERKLKLNALTQ
jgi:hypothetical protein